MSQTSVVNEPTRVYEGKLQTAARQMISRIGSGLIYFGKAVVPFGTATAASKTGANGTYLMTPGWTIVVDVDNVGDATATWDAAAATIVDNTTYAVADQDGLTAIITLTGGDYDGIAQTVTFSGATTTAAQVASQMNAQLDGCSVDVSGGQVRITHDGKGTGMDIAAAAGTGGLTWDASTAGTGDVVDISAVTRAEVKTVVEADTTAVITASGSGYIMTSPTTGATSELDFKSGLALTVLGLSVEVVVGSAASATDNDKTVGIQRCKLPAAAGEIPRVLGVAFADTTVERLRDPASPQDPAPFGAFSDKDTVPIVRTGQVWVVSADEITDLDAGVYIRHANGSGVVAASFGSFRASSNGDYTQLSTGVRWIASETVGGVYYGLLELNLP